MKISRRTAVVAAGIVGVLTSTAPIAMAAPNVENPQAPQGGNGAGTSLSQQEGGQAPATTPQTGPSVPRTLAPANPQATPGAVPANPQATPGPVPPAQEGAPPAPAAPGEQAPQTAVPEQSDQGWSENQQWSPQPSAPAAPPAPEPPKEGPPFVTIDVTVYGLPELTPIALPSLPEGIQLPPPPVELLLHQVPDGQGAPTVHVTTAPPLAPFHL